MRGEEEGGHFERTDWWHGSNNATVREGANAVLRKRRSANSGPTARTAMTAPNRTRSVLHDLNVFVRAARTCMPASLIHTRVVSTGPSSSSMHSFLATTSPLRTSSIKTSAGIFSAARTASVQPSGCAAISSSARRRGLGERLCRVRFILSARPSRTPAWRPRAWLHSRGRDLRHSAEWLQTTSMPCPLAQLRSSRSAQ